MNKRQSDSVFVILAAIVFGVLMAWAGHTQGASQVFIFSVEEMDRLERAITMMQVENQSMKAELVELRKKCI